MSYYKQKNVESPFYIQMILFLYCEEFFKRRNGSLLYLHILSQYFYIKIAKISANVVMQVCYLVS